MCTFYAYVSICHWGPAYHFYISFYKVLFFLELIIMMFIKMTVFCSLVFSVPCHWFISIWKRTFPPNLRWLSFSFLLDYVSGGAPQPELVASCACHALIILVFSFARRSSWEFLDLFSSSFLVSRATPLQISWENIYAREENF